jgi:hypothetical protein
MLTIIAAALVFVVHHDGGLGGGVGEVVVAG